MEFIGLQRGASRGLGLRLWGSPACSLRRYCLLGTSVCFLLLGLLHGPSPACSFPVPTVTMTDVDLGAALAAWDKADEAVMPRDAAESAMPAHRGLTTVAVGLCLILLFLSLTEWRIHGRQKKGSLNAHIKGAQKATASLLNSPVRDLNSKLEREGKALSVRLLLFMSSVLCLTVGLMEILFTAGHRYTRRRTFPTLKSAPVLRTTAMVLLVLSFVGLYGAS